MSECKNCGQELIWVTLPDKHAIPMDPEKINVVRRDDITGKLKVDEARTIHYETCPNAPEEDEE